MDVRRKIKFLKNRLKELIRVAPRNISSLTFLMNVRGFFYAISCYKKKAILKILQNLQKEGSTNEANKKSI